MTPSTTPTVSPASPVFISGSLSIRHLPRPVAHRLSTIIDRGLPVVIGDAPGADAVVQRHLADRAKPDVMVYCSDPTPRANLGNWPIRVIAPEGARGTAAFHAGKDRAMAQDAQSGLAIWDGRSRGTLANIHRLCLRKCFVLVWFAPGERFLTLRSDADRIGFQKAYPAREP
jgi:hypothetical protein